MAGWATRAWMGRARYLDIGSDHPCRQGEGRLALQRGSRNAGRVCREIAQCWDRYRLQSLAVSTVGGRW